MKRIRIYKLFLFILICMSVIFDVGGVEYNGFNRPAYAQASGSTGDEHRGEPVKGIKSENGIDAVKPLSEKESDLTAKSVEKNSAAEDIPGKNIPEKSDVKNPDAVDRSKIKKSAETSKVIFNFDDAELSEVIRTLAELLKINYMVEPKVGGKVTIHTAGELNRDDLFEVFYQILELNGLTAIKQEKVYRITPLKDVARLPIMARVDQNTTVPSGERIIIQIIPLNFVSPKEVVKLITPFISSEGTIISQENTNILVVVDKADNLSKIIRLVNVFDTDIFERFSHRFYFLQYGDVETIAEIARGKIRQEIAARV